MLLSVTVCGGLWCFGAWEMWWFWPFSTVLFLSFSVFLLRVLHKPSGFRFVDDEGRVLLLGFGCVLPFLFYAVIRAVMTEVTDTALRSVFMFIQPVLVFVMVVLSFSLQQLRLFGRLLVINLALLALYAAINMAITGSELILWRSSLASGITSGRATGTFFNPDHFATVMGIGVSLGLGFVLARREDSEKVWLRRGIGGGLVLLCGLVIGLSLSRGAGIAVLGTFLVALIWSGFQWPRPRRWVLQ